MSEWKETDIGIIPSGWSVAVLENYCSKVSVGYVGLTSKYFTSINGIPLLRSQNIKDGKLNLNNLEYVTQEFHEKNNKSRLQPNDVLVVRVGENRGDVCMLKHEFKEVNCANIVFFRPDNNYSKFFELYLRSPIGKHFLLSLTTGSAQGVLNTNSIAKILVPIPSIQEAREISEIFSSLEDKIDLLHRNNKTLEQLAETLFRQWFVEGANDSWEERKLGEFIKTVSG